MAWPDEFLIEVDLLDGEGFRAVKMPVPVPQAVAEEAKKEILSASARLGASWDVRIVRAEDRA